MTDDVMNNLSTTLLQRYWWVFLLIIGLNILKMFMPKIKGHAGEGLVNFATALRLDSKVYHLIKDVTVPSKNGTTQIDHVIVSKFGVFVIETKNYKGWIFANARRCILNRSIVSKIRCAKTTDTFVPCPNCSIFRKKKSSAWSVLWAMRNLKLKSQKAFLSRGAT